jgi:hypothetical protein
VTGGGPDGGAPGREIDAGAMPAAFEARSEFEAQCVRSVLEDAGIASVMPPTGQAIFGFPLRTGGNTVPVRVLPEDLSRARQVLAEARWAGKSIDWDEVDVGEVPPEVERMLRGGRAGRWIRRVILGVAWVLIAVIVVFGLVIPFLQRILP